MKNSLLARLSSIGVRRNEQWLVQDIDLAIHRGEIVSLIGPNGSGKTTLTKVLAKSITPDTGTVELATNIRIGYVPQRINIAPTLPMTVRRLMKVPQQVTNREIGVALKELNIQHLVDSQVQRLSDGEFQRALFARAILRQPDLLILDEPAQGLDFQGEGKLYDKIADVRDQLNCGVLLVSHDLHLVMAKTDTVVCINRHICCTGTPELVQNNEAYLALFGPRAVSATHAVYTHSHDHNHQLDGSISKP